MFDSGSFRDRNGRVYRVEGEIIRGLSPGALENFDCLRKTGFYDQFLERGQLVGSEVLSPDQLPLPAEERMRWAGFLRHERIPVVTYPYEWTFGMLKSAALLQLDLVESAIGEGMALKDATPYNIQFRAGQAVFIDIPSFEVLQAGEPWTGYRQFCELFLFPLMLQAYKGIPFQPLLRGRIDGIDVQTAAGLLGLSDSFRKGVLSHVWLQAKLDRRFGGTRRDVRAELKSAGFHKELVLANVRKLRRLIARLEWSGANSEWGGYEEFHNYSEDDHRLKTSFVAECISASRAGCVWDIGCNTGQFSKVAADHAEQVLAMDSDHFAVERLYREVRSEARKNILPLVQNIVDPSPNWGWRNRERTDLQTRASPDLILCLALVHHVVISANVPLGEFIAWLASTAPQLVIEYVSRSDDKVKTLLRNKADSYDDYSREHFEAALARHYAIRSRKALGSGKRFLYWCVGPGVQAAPEPVSVT